VSTEPEPFYPKRGDAVERWLREHREADSSIAWKAMVSDLITDYRQRAAAGLSLDGEPAIGGERARG
jgi:hypothetical protein